MMTSLFSISIVSLLPYLVPVGTWAGYLLLALGSLYGLRWLSTFYSFFLGWRHYRQPRTVTTANLLRLPHLPFVKFQITTRGLPDSTATIRRSIQHILTLVRERPELYGPLLSVELVTESWEQKLELEQEFARAPLKVLTFLVPPHYETPRHTRLKARALHYIVELRRRGMNRQAGQTFLVHFDEDSMMLPNELKKLLASLATTNKQLLLGPIHYALFYSAASVLTRTIAAHRVVGQLAQCDRAARGGPLHIHGSNLVLDEQLENALGWDFGTLEGQPFIAEDFLFGMFALCARGPAIFGWHGCVLLEQPPFAPQAAWQQQFRWTTGLLQGLIALQRMPEFRQLSATLRVRCIWGTRSAIFAAALGLPTGILALLYVFYQALLLFFGHSYLLPFPLTLAMTLVAFLWLNAFLIGAWYNLSAVQGLSSRQRCVELLQVIALAPFATILESAATCWAVVRWLFGNQSVTWPPIPKSSNQHKQRYGGAIPVRQPYRFMTRNELERIQQLREQRPRPQRPKQP